MGLRGFGAAPITGDDAAGSTVRQVTAMSSATRPAPADFAQHHGVRVRLSAERGEGPSDGAWWPHTKSLQAEIPGLDLAVHALTGARIARVAYVIGVWDPAPRAVRTPLGMTRIGWFKHAARPDNIDLSLTNYAVLVLTVIPPDTDAVHAELLLLEGGQCADAAAQAMPATDRDGTL